MPITPVLKSHGQEDCQAESLPELHVKSNFNLGIKWDTVSKRKLIKNKQINEELYFQK